MGKKKSKEYVCTVCGYRSPVKLGKCPECGSWNSFVEVDVDKVEKSTVEELPTPVSINSQKVEFSEERIKTGIEEFDRVLGGGIVNGSIILIGGEPGIGKSTLLLQIAGILSKIGKVLYVSGEESYLQIRMRANRLGVNAPNLFILIEQNMEKIRQVILQERPVLVIIDSVQTMQTAEATGAQGSVTQVRESTRIATEIAKGNGIPVILVGHVTKKGGIAGPKTIEHMVDGVFYIEGDRMDVMRLFRSVKNRFGTTNEAGIFEMQEKGLVQVKDPSLVFISDRGNLPVGSAISSVLEGTLPLFVEVQALATPTYFPIPRRVANGIDYNRILLISAILEKHMRLKMGGYDLYINSVGGIKLTSRSVDLSIAAAIMSSMFEKPVLEKSVIFGELGLGGEVRPTVGAERKVKQGKRLGFENFVLPAFFKGRVKVKDVNLYFVKNLNEVKEVLF
jgi:DNA repair protein RadA/Sms